MKPPTKPRRVNAIKAIEARMLALLETLIAEGVERNRYLPDGTVNTTRPDREIMISLSLNDAREIHALLEIGKQRV